MYQQIILNFLEKSGRIMKRTSQRKEKNKNRKITTVLLIAAAVLLVVGLVFLMIEPIKRHNRKKISSDAVTAISEKIDSIETQESAEETQEEVQITYTVPASGNEVPGEEEGYDIGGEEAEEGGILEEKPDVNGNVTLNSIGILKINAIGISYSVWDEATKVSLRYGLGHYPDSAIPGEPGNATILGHNYKDGTMFHNLGKLKKGDKVVFKSKNGKETTFVIQESKIISADDLYKYIGADVSEDTQLTLVTCTYEYGKKGWRRIVICKKQ
jgi:LPXTG-site transpeptidase (sortase) family protein